MARLSINRPENAKNSVLVLELKNFLKKHAPNPLLSEDLGMVQKRALKIILPTKSYNDILIFKLCPKDVMKCAPNFLQTLTIRPTNCINYRLLNMSRFTNLGTLGCLNGLKPIQTGLRINTFIPIFLLT